ncbi:hypothetical protein D3C87_1389790 [compost metagenome]
MKSEDPAAKSPSPSNYVRPIVSWFPRRRYVIGIRSDFRVDSVSCLLSKGDLLLRDRVSEKFLRKITVTVIIVNPCNQGAQSVRAVDYEEVFPVLP